MQFVNPNGTPIKTDQGVSKLVHDQLYTTSDSSSLYDVEHPGKIFVRHIIMTITPEQLQYLWMLWDKQGRMPERKENRILTVHHHSVPSGDLYTWKYKELMGKWVILGNIQQSGKLPAHLMLMIPHPDLPRLSEDLDGIEFLNAHPVLNSFWLAGIMSEPNDGR